MAKILIAEDERDIRDLVAFTLRFAGHEVFAAPNGEEAVELATKVNPDLILMDVRMPRMTGYEACKVMKANPDLKDIPVVFLTARGQETEIQQGLEAGCRGISPQTFRPRSIDDPRESHIGKIWKIIFERNSSRKLHCALRGVGTWSSRHLSARLGRLMAVLDRLHAGCLHILSRLRPGPVGLRR